MTTITIEVKDDSESRSLTSKTFTWDPPLSINGMSAALNAIGKGKAPPPRYAMQRAEVLALVCMKAMEDYETAVGWRPK